LLTGVHLFFESNQLFLNYEIDAWLVSKPERFAKLF
jgi:hypothetical protein